MHTDVTGNIRIEFCQHQGQPFLRVGERVWALLKFPAGTTWQDVLAPGAVLPPETIEVYQSIILWWHLEEGRAGPATQIAPRADCGYALKQNTSGHSNKESTDGRSEPGGSVELRARMAALGGMDELLAFLAAEEARLDALLWHKPSLRSVWDCRYWWTLPRSGSQVTRVRV